MRKMTENDIDEVFNMMRVFYDSPAVLNTASDTILMQDIKDCIGDCPFVEGYILEQDGKTAGYSMIAKSYSTEYGGMCIWIEDIYLKPEYRCKGIVNDFFAELEKKYVNAVRFRLEAEEENEHAVMAYKKNGYTVLPYIQLTKENKG